ncbi:MAG: putative secreted protein [Candidatus Phytoplasma cynodontis]|uniref:hypothetical protein n=1 Tax='Cynodon dactylon' phytoplasma TaxID=295320 RepID=UPI001265D641|nr:hypothetical protein ['Cynodon dactylon' phytoplasma]KAB8121799.1 hypothetical protein F1741_01565 ['Cynodon dactylon' phytoplasma]WIA07734.1 MAG: putative secreted protein [Candidatus Phytoplasma cynodontis]
MKKIKQIKKTPLLYRIFLFLFFLISLIIYLKQVFFVNNFFLLIKKTFYFFTNQSNFLVVIILFLNFTNFKQNKYYPLLAFIVLIDILLTGLVWNFIASPKNELLEINKDFFTISLFQHLYIPCFYVIFFFSPLVPFNPFFTLKQAYLALIHPLFYLFYSLILAYGSQEKIYTYPYNFMNPKSKCNLSNLFLHFLSLDYYYQQKQGFLGVFINNIVLLIILSIFILFLYSLYRKINFE